jgi:chromosome segregation ATPase
MSSLLDARTIIFAIPFKCTREDQADEYRDLKKDLEQTAKNCRILQFKLRKAERRMEQLETDKHELEIQNQEFRNNSAPSTAAPTPGKGPDRISQLEQELNQTREQLAQSQREVQKLQSQIRTGSKDVLASGPVLSKSRSLEVIIWRKINDVQTDKLESNFVIGGRRCCNEINRE